MVNQTEKPIAVLFDMDGVIVLSVEAHLKAWEAFGSAKLGLNITPEIFYKSISGRKNEDFLADLLPGTHTAAELAQIAVDKEAFFRQNYGPYLAPVAGVVPLIRHLSALQPAVRMAVASSAPPENVEFVLNRFGIENAFPVIVNGSQVEKAKPDPAIYLLAAQMCGVSPDNCVVLEDAVSGVQAAKRAGMRCLAVTTSDTTEHLRLAGADAIQPDFTHVTSEYLRTLLFQVNCCK